MDETSGIAALGLENVQKTDEEFLATLLKILEVLSASDARSHREQDLAERVAYLSGKVEVLEKLLAGGP